MPTSTNDIYVDLGLLAERDWGSVIPTIFSLGATDANDISIVTEFDTYSSSSGTNNINIEAGLDPIFNGFEEDTEINFVVGSGIQSAAILDNIDVECIVGSGISVDLLNLIDTLEFGSISYSNQDDIKVKYSVPSRTRYDDKDIVVEYKVYIGHVNYKNDIVVDVLLADTKDYWCNTSVFSTSRKVDYYDVDVELGSGRIYILNSDLFSTSEAISLGVGFDIFDTGYNLYSYNLDIDMASGTVGQINACSFSTALGLKSVECDIRTRSLFIMDFFLDVEEFTDATDTIWVDLVDYVRTIDTSRSYFLVSGLRVPVTFSGIPYGYRMLYNPLDDFYSEGTLVYTAHVTNDLDDVIEQNYYLLFGYDISYTSLVDWGYNREVAVWSEASTLSYCVNTETDAYYFITSDLWSRDLGATIYPIEGVNLGNIMYPQDKVFYYGQTYKITISGVRDFDGNEMAKQTYTFTIEDPTSI